MSTALFASTRFGRARLPFLALLACASLFHVPLFAAKPAWKPVTPEELAETAPRLEKEAPAEVLFWSVEVDDRGFPLERRTTEYIRYKIFVPEKAEHITRISGIESTVSMDKLELRARLVLPGGRTQEFGKEAIKERTLEKKATTSGFLGWLNSGGPEVRERFLAVSGVEAGAILEFQISRVVNFPSMIDVVLAQREGLPVRKFDYFCRLLNDSRWFNRTFTINSQSSKLTEDPKAHTLTVTATDLPSVTIEPFVGPATDYALTILSCYEPFDKLLAPRSGKVPMPGKIDSKPGPWTVYATILNWVQRDRGYVTPRVKQLAAEITGSLTDDEAKARAIHTWIETTSQKYRRRPGPHPKATTAAGSLDDVIEIEKKPEILRPPEEFLWLAIALYQSAGLECHAVQLPDRTLARFSPKHVSQIFLPNIAAAVKLGGEWKFSCPHNSYAVPFGMLPWTQEGQLGLLAVERQQQFVPVPAAPPERSVITTEATLKLDAEGTLTGQIHRTFTGHTANLLRGELRSANNREKRNEVASTKLNLDPKNVELKITRVGGIDDAEKPVEIVATLTWTGYAIRTKDRLVLRPAVLRAEAAAPFAATERRHPIHFPYRWKEVDRVKIALPEGFEPEAPSAPASLPGEVLSFKADLAYDRAGRVLHVGREFVSQLLDVPPTAYPQLKGWYDRVSRADQHEVVFVRKPAANSGQ